MSKINSEKKSSSEIKKHIVEDSTGDTVTVKTSKICLNSVLQDLFNFLRQMHLTGGANGITVTYRDPAAFNNGKYHIISFVFTLLSLIILSL